MLIPTVDVFLLRVPLTQNRRDSLAFQIMPLGRIGGCVKSDFRISQNLWTGVSYVLKELRTHDTLSDNCRKSQVAILSSP